MKRFEELDLAPVIAVAACESEKLSGLRQDFASLRSADDRDAAPAPELQPFIAEHSECA